MPRWLFKMTAKHNRSEDALKNLSQGIENLLGWEYCCSCLFFTPLVRSYPFAIHSQNPPNFSPAFISYAQNADRQCSGLVLYSAQSNTLTGCINVPTNQPIPAYQHTLSAHTLTVPIPASPTLWQTRLAPLVSTLPTPITALACRWPSHSLRWGPWAPPGPHLASHPYPAHPASNKTQARPQGLQRVAPHQGIMTHPLSPWEKRNKWVNRTGDFPLNWPHFQVFLQRF